MGNLLCCRKKKIRQKIVLLLVGLDNSGKTKTAYGLGGDMHRNPIPNPGFSVVDLKYRDSDVKILDLAGGPDMRGFWHKYYVDAHGVIFVIDSSDYSRFNEAGAVLEEIMSSDKIAGKPLLLLANKQDNENAVDEVDIIESLQIERLANTRRCPTLVQSCSANEQDSDRLDPGIRQGYDWLLGTIIRNYKTLHERVTKEAAAQDQIENAEMLERIEQIKQAKLVEEKNNIDAIETYSDYIRKLNDTIELQETQNKESDGVLTFDEALNALPLSRTSSSSSSISFPPVYVHPDYGLPERPKSAVQIVKHQLQMNGSLRKQPLKSRSNKTTPINLYDIKTPQSAKERRTKFPLDTRNLKSADDRLFTICNTLPNATSEMGPSGDHYSQLRELSGQNKKLPYSNGMPRMHNEGGDRNLTVIDVE
ncbi:unnamed protein product [Acanthoscelides obtectus]|uniref:ADP-ribosylation factor-like protein 13B n=1 Tax=Acanthoscelides obtectus TaxID=200917 RepID=A0A9P0K5T0_ACAOB|nr:unnamed protein product [Acanthoscelides obtectus]CAK1631090.1 ADP-ribosylation factor-like protein 13B [Acanthoscelides obtectus]